MAESKAYSLEWMPVKFSRAEVLDWISKNPGTTRQEANQILYTQETLVRTAPERAKIRIDDDPPSWRGRNVERPTAMVGKPTQGGADNLRNHLRCKLVDWSPDGKPLTFRYVTTDDLTLILADKYGPDCAPSKRKMACDPANGILKYHLIVRRWSWWTAPAPNPNDFKQSATVALSKRISLYGHMPRLRHSPNGKFVLAESQVVQWMSQKSGEVDLALVEAERNRFPFVWVNSVTGQTDSDRKLSRAIMVYDRGTGETLGITTWQGEVAARPKDEQKAEPELTKEQKRLHKRQEEGKAPAGDEDEIERSSNGYMVIDANNDFWIGDAGREIKIPNGIIDDVEWMKGTREKDARKFFADLFRGYSVSIERFIDGAVDLELLYRDGDHLEGYGRYSAKGQRSRQSR